MPITVTCPACSASFTVKDEYAGKRAKCPTCSEPLTVPAAETPAPPIPAARPVAAPVVARPVVAARVPAKPPAEAAAPPLAAASKRRRDDDEDEDDRPKRDRGSRRGADDDEPVNPKRKRGASDDDEDDKPAAKRRKGGDDEDDEKPAPKGKRRGDGDEDDQPASPKRARGIAADDDDTPKRKRGGDDEPTGGRRRRRDDDEDEPKKKSKALPIILGIVGGVLLLCGGGCAGVYFFVIKPAGEAVASKFNALTSEAKQEREFRNKSQQVRSGMTRKQVEDLLGTNHTKASETDVVVTTAGLFDSFEAQNRWKPKAKQGHVLKWERSGDSVLVAFSADPNAGGSSVVGVVSSIDFDTTEPVTLAAAPKGDAKNPVATLTADELSRQHATYRDRWVKVSGVYSHLDQFRTGSVVLRTQGGAGLTVHPPLGALFPFKEVQPQQGETMTFTGKVGGSEGAMTLDDAVFVSRTGGTASPPVNPNAALSVTAVMQDAGRLQGKSLDVRGKVKLVIEHLDGDQGTIVFEPNEGMFTLHAVFPPGKWRKDFVRGGEDTIEVRGTLSGLLGKPGTGLHYDLTDCELTRRTDKDGKDVPLPPVTPAKKPVAITAEDLAAEFAKNQDAAAKKYTERMITVTGTVEKAVAPSGSRVTLKGVAADGTKKAFVVDVGMIIDAREDAKKLKVGDTVKFTGKYQSFRPAVGTTIPNTVMLSNGVIEK